MSATLAILSDKDENDSITVESYTDSDGNKSCSIMFDISELKSYEYIYLHREDIKLLINELTKHI